MLIKSTLCCDKSYNSPRCDLIKRFSEKVVVYIEILSVIPSVRYAVIAERNITDSCVKEIVGICGILISLNLNIRCLIELLCDTTCYAVYLDTVQVAFLTHFVGHNTEKVSDTHSRLKDIAARKAEVFKSLVDSVYDRRRGVVCV